MGRQRRKETGAPPQQQPSLHPSADRADMELDGEGAAATGGATLVGFSSAPLSWVVCCATPTWVVSLAMMGMSASLALWLEPLGDFITIAGFLLLFLSVWFLARRRVLDAETLSPKLKLHSASDGVRP